MLGTYSEAIRAGVAAVLKSFPKLHTVEASLALGIQAQPLTTHWPGGYSWEARLKNQITFVPGSWADCASAPNCTSQEQLERGLPSYYEADYEKNPKFPELCQQLPRHMDIR